MPRPLLDTMAARGARIALDGDGGPVSYAGLVNRTDAWVRGPLAGLAPAAVVAFDCDYGPGAVSLLLALARCRAVAIPLSRDVAMQHSGLLTLGQAEYHVRQVEGTPTVAPTGTRASHPLYTRLREDACPGLVLFSSGSTGTPKAVVHDLSRMLVKYRATRPGYRTLGFLQLDHIGGLNTLFSVLGSGGTLVPPTVRTPDAVGAAIARHRVELLPTSPTFVNLLLLAETHRRRDLSSLRRITYGTEPMPAITLRRAAEAFPGVHLQQTYGLSELGILRSESRSADSLWVRVGGDGFETRVAEGRLWVRAASAMLGYLNAPTPFDSEGYFDTGDMVEVDGEWLRFVGRDSEVINVGGSKVFPAEVESALLEMDNVADAVVRGEPSLITGHVVTATVTLVSPEDPAAFKLRMRRFCAERLAPHKVPVKVRVADQPLHTERFKRRRLDA